MLACWMGNLGMGLSRAHFKTINLIRRADSHKQCAFSGNLDVEGKPIERGILV
jgi:hypothetical protein